MVYEVSTALIHSRYVPKGLYERAVKLLGNNGVTDLTVLIGYFSMVRSRLSSTTIFARRGMKR